MYNIIFQCRFLYSKTFVHAIYDYYSFIIFNNIHLQNKKNVLLYLI